MPERWETYQVGNVVRLRRVGGKPKPAAKPEPADNYDAILKEEVVALAEARGIDSTGTKAQIVARLRDADGN